MICSTSKWKLTLIIFLLLLSTGCVLEPTSEISSKLASLDINQGKRLLVKEVDDLSEWISFRQKIDDSTHAYIFQNALAKDLYKHSYKHNKHTRAVIADDEVGLDSKKLLIRFSQCLGVKDYLHFGQEIINTGNVELIAVYLSPGPEYGLILYENYLDSDVIDFLSEVSQKHPSLKETVELIKSGSNLKMINAYRESGENYPVLGCPPASR